uniref:Uncharacterized protein n=1 Tax=viral metagenome TaxID=1070528 RepID=A0A6C0D9R6_9ZZZZ
MIGKLLIKLFLLNLNMQKFTHHIKTILKDNTLGFEPYDKKLKKAYLKI